MMNASATRSLLFVAALVAAYSWASLEVSAQQPPSSSREFRAAWVATVANIDWPSKPGLSTDAQKDEINAILDCAAELNLNAIILQVRPAADAIYKSDLEPWSEYLTGEMGKAPSPGYDPLKLWVAGAHKRGMQLHAWFNPYRAIHPSAKSPADAKHVSRTRPEVVRTYGRYQWLDPGEPEATDHSIAVIKDVVRRYDVDGVHLDDYFYPYPIRDDAGKEVPFPDDASWEKAREAGWTGSRDDWRRSNVDGFIERMYREVKAEKPWVLVGISPFGIWRPGHPKSIQGFDQYSKLYADARKWFLEGWVDYMTPQLYWPIDQKPQSYPVLLQWWSEQNKHSRHLWPGNFTSKISEGLPAVELVRQVEVTRCHQDATGNVHFSMKALQKNYGGVADLLSQGQYALPALVPASPWLGDERPGKPVLSASKKGKQIRLSIEPGDGAIPGQWLVQVKAGPQWIATILPGKANNHSLPVTQNEKPVSSVAVSALSRTGLQGPVAVVDLPTPQTPEASE